MRSIAAAPLLLLLLTGCPPADDDEQCPGCSAGPDAQGETGPAADPDAPPPKPTPEPDPAAESCEVALERTKAELAAVEAKLALCLSK